MTRVCNNWRPRLRLWELPQPLHPPLWFDFMSNAAREQTTVAPGRRTSLQWLDLMDAGGLDFDGIPGLPANWKPQAILADYDIRWTSTDASRWTHEPQAEERAWLDLAKAHYETERDRLQAIEEDDRDETERQELTTALQILEQIADGGLYLRTQWNAQETGASGIYWGLGAANVPVTVSSTFYMSKDRSFTIRLFRFLPPTGQARYSYTIEFGNGNTLYALVIGEDGNQTEFVHYRNMSPGRRASLLAQLNTVLDTGRLTVADMTQIQAWVTEAQALRNAIKLRGGEKTDAESETLTRLKAQEQALRDSKSGLTRANEERRRTLENQLYLAREKFNLQEEARELLGKSIDITVQFLRSGFVAVTCDDTTFVYENKRITGLVPPAYSTMLPDKGFVTLRSDGGQWGVVYGHPQYRRQGSFWSQPFEVPFDFDMDEDVAFDFDGDANGEGCTIDFTLELLEPAQTSGGMVRPARYQMRVDMLTADFDTPEEVDEKGGWFTPELYRGAVHIATGVPTVYGDPVWDSNDHSRNGLACIVDVVMRDDDQRSPHCQVFINNHLEGAGLPLHLAGMVGDLDFLNLDTGLVHKVMKHALIPTQPRARIKRLAGQDIEAALGHEVQIDLVGLENALNRDVECRLIGNDKYPNDFLRELARDAGLLAADYAGVGSGNIGIPKIPRQKPCEYPTVQVALGCTYLNMMQDIVKNFCIGWILRSGEEGLELVRDADRDRPELEYDNLPTVDVDSRLCLRGEFMLQQDIRDYVTTVVAVGGVDPLRGLRYVGSDTVPQAYQAGFEESMYWVGDDIRRTLPVDDSLTSVTACIKRARHELEQVGVPPWYGMAEVDFDPTVRTRDAVRVFGYKYRVGAVEFGALNANDETGPRLRLELRLLEEIPA